MQRVKLPSPISVLQALFIVLLLASGCSTSMPRSVVPTHAHPVVGTWEFLNEGLSHRREFTPDGKCIMYRGRTTVDKNKKTIEYKDNGEAVQVCDFVVVSSRKVLVIKIDRRKKKLPYEVLADGRLSVEERHIAKRIK